MRRTCVEAGCAGITLGMQHVTCARHGSQTRQARKMAKVAVQGTKSPTGSSSGSRRSNATAISVSCGRAVTARVLRTRFISLRSVAATTGTQRWTTAPVPAGPATAPLTRREQRNESRKIGTKGNLGGQEAPINRVTQPSRRFRAVLLPRLARADQALSAFRLHRRSRAATPRSRRERLVQRRR